MTKKPVPQKKIFSQVEEDYILKNKGLPPATLAKALGTTVDVVKDYLDGLMLQPGIFDKVVGKRKGKDGKTTAVVMTDAASQHSDASRQKSKPDPNCIHPCKPS